MWRRSGFIQATLLLCGLLAGCGTTTMPASVSMDDGTHLVGTATASMSAGTFEVATADKSLTCSGNYDQYSTARLLTAPFVCTDGRSGAMAILRTPDLRAGTGTADLSDGTRARVAFGRLAGSEALGEYPDPPVSISVASVPSSSATSSPQSTSAIKQALIEQSQASYSGACPCPYNTTSSGRRCGGNSAYSRPGGASPLCYPGDVTEQMVERYRARL